MKARFEEITGHYVNFEIEGIEYRVYYEEAGEGIPLLVGHTAGSDGRQYRHLLNDKDVTSKFRVIAFDLPYHGKSLPPYGVEWWAQEYNMDKKGMMDFPNIFSEVLGLERPVYMGSSMGGHLAIDLAINYPEKYRATIALEGALKSAKEYRDAGVDAVRREFDNPCVSRTSTGAAMLLNMCPSSPEAAVRETQWMYMCGGPGVFAGDLYYYYVDHILSPEDVAKIDTSKCMLYLLNGEYDPNTPPSDGKIVHDIVKGSKFWAMKELGHFPASENYPKFKDYIVPVLDEIAEKYK